METAAPPGEAIERLMSAIREGRDGEAQVLVDSNPALAEARDPSGVSAVVLALYHGRTAVAQMLAARRSNLDVFEAASLGDSARVDALISADRTLAHAWSPDGFTALGLASFFGRLPVVRSLLERGADPNAIGRNAGKYTPLTGAVTAGHADVVRELLQAGADVKYRYAAGYSPLHVAAANGSLEIVRMLLAAGADPGVRTDDGQTPRDFALHREHPEVAALLT